MHAIFGIFNFDGRPVQGETFERWAGGLPIPASAASSGRKHCAVRLWGPEKLDLRDLTLVARARLDNREELIALLDLPSNPSSPPSDAALIAHAYRKWGLDLGSRLMGDWAFGLWDEQERRLVLGHDFLGAAGLYYYRSLSALIFASSLPELLAHPDVPKRVNHLAIAQMSLVTKRDTSTFYKDIYSLRPAHISVVTSEGMENRRYWFPERIRPVRFPAASDYIDAFRDIYREAVRCRIHASDSVGIFMSGGLDSTSVAAIAAPELGRQGRRLTSWTWIPGREVADDDKTACFDESLRVLQVRDYVGNLDTTFLRPDAGPLAGFQRVLRFLGQPSYSGTGSFWTLPLLEAAQSHGVKTLLTGDWGNYTISWRGKLPLKARLRRIAGSWRDQFVHISTGTAPRGASSGRGVVRPYVARRAVEQFPAVDPTLALLRVRTPQPLQSVYNLLQSGAVAVATRLAECFGMDLRIPPLDKRVVEYCLGIPNRCYTHRGQSRLLIRNAMNGLLPDEILEATQRGRVFGDMTAWIRTEYAEITDVLQRLQRSPLANEWLDLPAMVAGLEAVRHSRPREAMEAFAPTLCGLPIGLFFLQMEHG